MSTGGWTRTEGERGRGRARGAGLGAGRGWRGLGGRGVVGLSVAGVLWLGMVGAAAAPPPPQGLELVDDPQDDAGTVLVARWSLPAGKPPPGWWLGGFRLLLAAQGKPFAVAELIVDPKRTEAKLKGLDPRRLYRARVEAVYVPRGQELAAAPDKPKQIAPGLRHRLSVGVEAGPVRPQGKLFDPKKLNVLVGVLLYGAIVVITFRRARRGGEFYVRPIAGLQAVDDAIGRATEMGRPLLYVSGLGGVGSLGTLAAMFILGHLARRTAAYQTPILVPCIDPLVMAAEREIVREAYLQAGQPDAFRPENIFYITDSQFGYAAAVDGIIMRERPAANFFMGTFAAESLILAETGNMAGSVQIAGTDSDTQLPFFITACDYTLMGEELYAAGAYLSRHPLLVAQLRAQDLGKFILGALLVLGVALASAAQLGWLPKLHELFMRALAAG
jgi:hypothetical protein